MQKSELGWKADRESTWQGHKLHDSGAVGRIIGCNRNVAQVQSEDGHYQAHIPSLGSQLNAYPVVGDWCVTSKAEDENSYLRIIEVLGRDSQIRRKKAGRATEAQVIASNVDFGIVLTTRTEEFNWNRLDRYLTMILSEKIRPIICLTKADLDPDVKGTQEMVQLRFPSIPVLSISTETGLGINDLGAHLTPTETSVFLGSSGVGKSTLTNTLLGAEFQSTQEVRSVDGKGRHTTSSSEMFHSATFGWVIDVPGLREIEPWNAHEGIDETFLDILIFAQQCPFRNCQHEKESGCAVQLAITQGKLPSRMLKNYRRLIREQKEQDEKESQQSPHSKKKRAKAISKSQRQIIKSKYRF